MPAPVLAIPRDRVYLCEDRPLAATRPTCLPDERFAGVVISARHFSDPASRQAIETDLARRPRALLGVEWTCDLRAAGQAAAAAAALHRLPDQSLVLLRLVSSDPHDQPSAPRAVPAAAALVTELAGALARLRIVLSHRAGDWLCRVEDAVRLLMRVYQPNVGVAFNVADWRAVDGDMARLDDVIRLALPKLLAVCGAVTPSDLSRPLTTADSMLATALVHLERAGYAGPVILRCRDGVD
jgi:hypothetical protein